MDFAEGGRDENEKKLGIERSSWAGQLWVIIWDVGFILG